MKTASPSDFLKSFHLPQLAVCLAILVFTLTGSRIEGGFVIDGNGLILGRDFFNMWHYGLAAFSENPSAFYDFEFYNARLDSLIENYPDQRWSYPPHYMLISAPFGLLGYNMALAVISLLGGLLYWQFVVKPLDDNAAQKSMWLMPAFVLTLVCGQLSILLAVLLVAIYRTMDSRPVMAGLMIALLTVKPQIGFLFPVFLLATARWRVFASAALGTLALIAASMLLYGYEIWEVYVFSQLDEQSDLLMNSHPLTRGLMPSVAANLGILGVSKSMAIAVNMLVALVAAGLMIWCCRKCHDRFLQYAVFLGASFVATPYLMAYDTLVLGWAAVMLVLNYGVGATDRATYRLLVCLIPIGVIMSLANIPGSFLILLAFFGWSLSKTGLLQDKSSVKAAYGA